MLLRVSTNEPTTSPVNPPHSPSYYTVARHAVQNVFKTEL